MYVCHVCMYHMYVRYSGLLHVCMYHVQGTPWQGTFIHSYVYSTLYIHTCIHIHTFILIPYTNYICIVYILLDTYIEYVPGTCTFITYIYLFHLHGMQPKIVQSQTPFPCPLGVVLLYRFSFCATATSRSNIESRTKYGLDATILPCISIQHWASVKIWLHFAAAAAAFFLPEDASLWSMTARS